MEAVGSDGSVVVDYQYEQNVHSDSRFLADHLKGLPAQNEESFIVVDGAYSGQNLRDTALEKNVQLISTSLKGISVPDIYADFEISDDGKDVLHCPAGHKPLRCRYVSAAKQTRAYFPHDLCAGCPHLEQCHPKLNKVTGLIAISRSAIEKARQQRHMAEDDFQNWKRIRNGVETIPSALRNQYHVDDMPVHGRIPGKFFFGAKISATNFKKLLRQWRGLYCRSHNPLLA